MKKESEVVRVTLDQDAVSILDRLAPNSRRKSEVVEQLLLVAAKREVEIDRGDAPLDDLTRAVLGLRWAKEQARPSA